MYILIHIYVYEPFLMVGKLNYFNCTAILRFYECICGWYIELLPMNDNDETSQMLRTGGLAELLSSDLQHFNQRCCAPTSQGLVGYTTDHDRGSPPLPVL